MIGLREPFPFDGGRRNSLCEGDDVRFMKIKDVRESMMKIEGAERSILCCAIIFATELKRLPRKRHHSQVPDHRLKRARSAPKAWSLHMHV